MIFGTNMTVLDFTLSRTASRDWKEGDRILVSRLDHDGGVAPWIELAADRGFEVDWIDVTEDLRLDLDDLERKLDERVRVVACVASSNAVGTIVDFLASPSSRTAVGALVVGRRGAVRGARAGRRAGARLRRLHRSAYKFCGPHLGVAYGRHELLESWRPYKARPGAVRAGRAAGSRPGTAPYELLAGFSATIAYLESLGGMEVLAAYERELGQRFLEGLPDSVTVYGLQTMEGRVATFLLNVDGVAGRRRRDARSPSAATACGRTTTGTRSACARSCRTRRTRSASGSSTTTRRTRSTASSRSWRAARGNAPCQSWCGHCTAAPTATC